VPGPGWHDNKKNIDKILDNRLKGKTVMAMTAENWEDIEMCTPIMELMYRGADIVVGLFDPIQKARTAGWMAVEDSVKTMGGIYNWDWSATIDGNYVSGRVPMDAPEFIDAITTRLFILSRL